MEETDPKKVLREARELVKQRDYSAALVKYVWIHHHSLKYEPMFIGPRLSYAIMEWVELGEAYPPALIELEAIRDTKTNALKGGATEVHLFHDVRAINRALGQDEQTRQLFRAVAELDRGFASKCFPVCLEALVNAGDFALARSFIASLDEELERLALPVRSMLQSPKRKESHDGLPSMADVMTRIYITRVKQLLLILSGVGEEEEANRIRRAAFEIFDDAELRDRIIAQLSPTPPSARVQ